MYSPLVFDPINLFTDQSVPASTTSDPSDRLETTRLTKVQIRVKNTGPSTNVTVNIYSVDAATNGTGTGTGPNGKTPIAWRGIENPWGNVWKFGIGFNTTDTEIRVINRDGTGVLSGQLTAGNYEVSVNPPYVDPVIGYTSGYISDFESEALLKNMFVPSAISGSSSTRACDSHWTHNPGRTNILLLGGSWSYGSAAGVGFRFSRSAVSYNDRAVGARLEFIPPEGVV